MSCALVRVGYTRLGNLMSAHLLYVHRYSPQKRAKIGAYASAHGAAAAAKHFSKELGCMMKESTVKSIRNAYQEASRKQRIATGNPAVAQKKSEDVLFYWVILLTDNYNFI